MNQEQIEQFILQWVGEQAVHLPSPQGDTPLFEQGYLDSLSVYRLLLALQAELGLRAAVEDILSLPQLTARALAEILVKGGA